MKNLFRAIKFIKNYYKHPRFLFAYLSHFLSPDFKQEFNFFTYEEFRREILSGKSFIRIGDGETGIINGTGPTFYQKHEKRLAQILKEMIIKYDRSSPYILGIPQEFINKSNSELRARGCFYCWYQMKVTASFLFPKDVFYGDAIMFYYGDSSLKTFLDYIADKNVILVSNRETIDTWSKSQPPFSTIFYVVGHKKDAFTDYEKLIKEIEHTIEKNENNHDSVLLLSLGPTSKALAYYFSKKGVTCYDLGIGAEAFFQKKDLSNLVHNEMPSKVI